MNTVKGKMAEMNEWGLMKQKNLYHKQKYHETAKLIGDPKPPKVGGREYT